MKRKLWIPVLVLGIMAAALFIIMKINPPLEIGTIASNPDGTLVVIGIGNTGFQAIKISEVLVNYEEKPSMTKMQHSNALQGFTLIDDFQHEEARKFGFKNVEDVSIKASTSPSSTYEMLDKGTASESNESYGISVVHEQEIHKIYIKYNYFGIPFEQRISTNIYGAL